MTRDICLVIAVMAAVTYLIRMIPTLLIRKKIQNRYLLSVIAYLPYAVLSALTFPAIFEATGSVLASAAGCVVALILAFVRLPMVLVALAAALASFVALWVG